MEGIEDTWWETTIGDRPDQVHVDNQKKAKIQKSMIKGNLWTMICQPGRVDWTLEAIEKESDTTLDLLALGSMSTGTLEPFVNAIEKWLSICTPINRLAFGANLGKVTDNMRTGCEEIQQYLPSVELDPQNTANFLYQINRPRKSKVDSKITINRLNTWSMVIISTGGVMIDPTASKVLGNVQHVNVCKLELDINTASSNSKIAEDKAIDMFKELTEQGHEISNKGDVK